MRYRSMLVAAVMAIASRTASGQSLTSIPAPDASIASSFVAEPGAQVEGAGLRRWTLLMIQDSLAMNAGGVSFFRQSCRGARVRNLEIFPQSVAVETPGDSAITIFIALIEPQDSALVTVRTFKGNAKKSIAPWAPLVELGRTRIAMLEQGVIASIQARAAGLTPKLMMTTRADSAELTKVWTALAAHRTTNDADVARRLLATSPNVYDRLAAVTILSNFDQDDATWHALVGALLDPKDLVREYARAVLRIFTSDLTRRVDWSPAGTDLHALLQGSDLWSLNETLDMLVATGVNTELAAPLLHNGGHAVLMFAGAQNSWARGPAHRFLHAVSGKNFGASTEAWRTWIASL